MQLKVSLRIFTHKLYLQVSLEVAKLKRWEKGTASVQFTSQIQLHPGNQTVSLQNGAQKEGNIMTLLFHLILKSRS